MKRILPVLLALLVLVLFSSCDILGGGALNSSLQVSISVYSDHVSVSMYPSTSGSVDMTGFQDAVVSANGTAVPYSYSDSDYISFSNYPLSYSPGDSVTVTISHADLNSISGTIVLPPEITTASLGSGEASYIAGTQATLDMSWTPVSCDYTLPWIHRYDATPSLVDGSATHSYGSSHTFDQNDMYFYGTTTRASDAAFSIQAVNSVDLAGCGPYSAIRGYSADNSVN